VHEETPKVFIGPHLEKEDTNIAPFYITLTIHD
jgi:hypothetical protein